MMVTLDLESHLFVKRYKSLGLNLFWISWYIFSKTEKNRFIYSGQGKKAGSNFDGKLLVRVQKPSKHIVSLFLETPWTL